MNQRKYVKNNNFDKFTIKNLYGLFYAKLNNRSMQSSEICA